MNVSQREALSSGALSNSTYEAHIQRDVMVPMRDEVLLATDLHRPAQGGQPLDGPFPVLLLRTPYKPSPPRKGPWRPGSSLATATSQYCRTAGDATLRKEGSANM